MTVRTDPHRLFDWPSGPVPGGIEVLGVPSDFGNSIASGARFGPEAIRAASAELPRPAMRGADLGDVEDVNARDWSLTIEHTRALVEAIAARDSVPLLLGGDHSVTFAAVAALRGSAPLNIVWFDAHTDFCPWPNGDWHNHKQVLRRIAGLDHVGEMLQVGHRGITYIDESTQSPRLRVFNAGSVSSLDAQTLLDALPDDEPVYISVDIDAVDPRWAPGTGHPVPGGLTVEQLMDLATAVATNRRVVGFDLTEVNPMLDIDGITARAAARILAAISEALAFRSRTVPA